MISHEKFHFLWCVRGKTLSRGLHVLTSLKWPGVTAATDELSLILAMTIVGQAS